MGKSLPFSFTLIGVNSMVGQIVLMRELMVVFYGNELSVGVILSSWLLWVSVGSWVLGKVADGITRKLDAFKICQIAVFVIFPSSIYFVRNVRNIIGVGAGEIIGLTAMVLSAFIILAPLCITIGFMFTLGCRIAADVRGEGAGGIGRVYVLESIGASVGGLLFNFLLIHLFDPFQIAFFIGATNLIAIYLMSGGMSPRNSFSWISLALVVLTAIALLSGGIGTFHSYATRLRWKGQDLVHSFNSIYGNIAVTSLDGEFNFFENGILMFSTGDLLGFEEMIHIPMLEHPLPKKVLLIGSGVGGPLREVLKHPVEKVDYVELDPALIRTAEKVFPADALQGLRDPRVEVEHVDGRLFVDRSKDDYDVVIVGLPDPFTAVLNRFYSIEFFTSVKEILSPNGVISFGLSSSENYLSPEQAEFLGCIYFTLKDVFPDVRMIPGDICYFLASPASDVLTYDAGILIERLQSRKVDAQFVREYYLPYKLSSDRIGYIESSVGSFVNVRRNRDFEPVGYFYDTVLWSTRFRFGVEGLIGKISGLRPWHLLSAIGILLAIFLTYTLRASGPTNAPVILTVATTGLSEMSFQVVVIVAFQVLYGYVYYRLGLILVSFMIGLSLGSWTVNRVMGNFRDDLKTYTWTQLSIFIYPLILPLIFYGLSQFKGNPGFYAGLGVAFSFLPIVAGFIGGFQFPLAGKICLAKGGEVGRTAGLLYGVDLLGSCFGAILVSIVLVPIIGIVPSCLITAALNLSGLVLLLVYRTKHREA